MTHPDPRAALVAYTGAVFMLGQLTRDLTMDAPDDVDDIAGKSNLDLGNSRQVFQSRFLGETNQSN
jgi:hypothetical protein